jgi:hypothetical protein
MTGGTLIAINLRAGVEVLLVGFDRRGLGRFAINAGVERPMRDLPLEWQRVVRYGDWRVAEVKPGPDCAGHKQNAEKDAKD